MDDDPIYSNVNYSRKDKLLCLSETLGPYPFVRNGLCMNRFYAMSLLLGPFEAPGLLIACGGVTTTPRTKINLNNLDQKNKSNAYIHQ